jgi:hypothetical protein
MSFGTTLTSYRDVKGGNKQVAPILHQRWPHPEDRPEISTIGSRLSELVAEKARGVKFFFDDLAVAHGLFEALEVPTHEREALMEEAAGLAAGAPPPRLIVEASALPGDDRETVDRLFPLIEAQIPLSLAPVAIVVREAQYKWLPRSIEAPRFVIQRVADEAAGSAAASALANRRGLLWSPRRGTVPVERWVAVQFAGDKLNSYPPDALNLYAARGTLAVPAPAFRSLQSFGVVPEPASAPTDPLKLRKLYDDLQSPTMADHLGRPSLRVGLASALGIEAAATERECIEHDIAATAREVGLEATRSDTPKLKALLDRATRREVPPTLLRVGDELHAVNAVKTPDRGNLTAHQVAPRRALITRLLDAVAGRTRDDWRDDRFLEQGFEPEEAEQIAYRTARATLLHTGVELHDAPSDPNGVAALGTLLDGAAPAARLAIGSERDADWFRLLCTKAEFDRLRAGRAAGDEGYWRLPPALDECLISRNEELLALEVKGKPASENHPLVPVRWERLDDANAWLDVLDAEQEAMTKPAVADRYGHGPTRLTARRAFMATHKSPLLGAQAWQLEAPGAVAIGTETWRTADHHLALCWRALRRGLVQPDAIALHDGTVLLALGQGVFAVIDARKHGPQETGAGAWMRCNFNWRGGLQPLLAPAATHLASSPGGSTLYPVGPIVPRGLLLVASGKSGGFCPEKMAASRM